MLSFKMETGERRIRRMFEIGEYVVCGAKGEVSRYDSFYQAETSP